MSELKNSLLLQDKSDLNRKELAPIADDCKMFPIGSFLIKIDQITIANLKKMRKLLPKNEYQLLKNRKCAQLCRASKKE